MHNLFIGTVCENFIWFNLELLKFQNVPKILLVSDRILCFEISVFSVLIPISNEPAGTIYPKLYICTLIAPPLSIYKIAFSFSFDVFLFKTGEKLQDIVMMTIKYLGNSRCMLSSMPNYHTSLVNSEVRLLDFPILLMHVCLKENCKIMWWRWS